MPKKVRKSMKRAAPYWPEPKRGKRRVQRKPSSKPFVKVPYVRHGCVKPLVRVANQRWGTSIQSIMSLRGIRLINMLKKKDILPEWKGKLCPRCGVGKMGPLKYNTANKTWTHRCNHYKCHKNLQPHDFHPIFYMGAGNSHSPLHVQASILLCATAGVKEVSTHLILDTSKKPVETIYKNLETARSRYVNAKEKDITYGDWHDVEVDEVDVGKFVDPSIQDAKNTTWEQWGGMVERGNPSSLRLFRLNPKKTKQSAPGPGPIRKCDWVPVAKKYLKNMNVVLHSDGARAYTMKFPGIIHCNVVHKKKRKIVKGKDGRLTNGRKHESFNFVIFFLYLCRQCGSDLISPRTTRSPYRARARR